MPDQPPAPKPEQSQPEPAPVEVHVHTAPKDEDDDKPKRSDKILLALIGILGTMATVLVTAWANYRFDTNQEKTEEAAEKLDELAELLERAEEREENAQRVSRTELANMRMIVLRLERIMQMTAAREEVLRQARAAWLDALYESKPAADLEGPPPDPIALMTESRTDVIDFAFEHVQSQLPDQDLDEAELYDYMGEVYDDYVEEQIQAQEQR